MSFSKKKQKQRDRWHCVQCGHCCRHIQETVDKSLWTTLQAKLNSCAHYPFKVNTFQLFITGHCEHLSSKRGKAHCNIYNERPDMCRHFKCWYQPELAYGYFQSFNFLKNNTNHNNPEEINKRASEFHEFCIQTLKDNAIIKKCIMERS